MKIKELINTLGIGQSRGKLALRISHCLPQIKKAFLRLHDEEAMPNLRIALDVPNGRGYLELTAQELVRIYGMKKYQALLFMDELMKAKDEENPARLKTLLDMLKAGLHRQQLTVSDEMKETIRTENPASSTIRMTWQPWHPRMKTGMRHFWHLRRSRGQSWEMTGIYRPRRGGPGRKIFTTALPSPRQPTALGQSPIRITWG